MKHIVMKCLPLFLIDFLSAPALAANLIVVEDRGGASALPYYEALVSPRERAGPPVPPIPPVRFPLDAEAAMLPVHSTLLSPGDEPPRAIRAPGLTPLFLVGDDARSRDWLVRRYAELREARAVGLVVEVSSPSALAALRRLAPELPLVPASGDDLARRLGIRHYPLRITATGIAP